MSCFLRRLPVFHGKCLRHHFASPGISHFMCGRRAAPGGSIRYPILSNRWRKSRFAGLIFAGSTHLLLAAASLSPVCGWGQVDEESFAAVLAGPLPDAPEPQAQSASPTPKPNPCPVPTKAVVPGKADGGVHPAEVPCTPRRLNWYQRFANGPKSLTARDKAWLAVRNLADPFNLITIGGEGAISVAIDSHNPYGPGMPGYGRYVGSSFTQDMTGEFFGTFAIPAIAHQDPHYHRREGDTFLHRARHAALQILWTQSDTGKGMPNYANLVGFPIEDSIANLYVPGRHTNFRADAERYGTALATAPIGNFVNEFLPDVASHIHVQTVILQRIINQVAGSATINSTASP
jgi:hypothetical protein